MAISIGDGHACVTLDNSSAACWGYNFYGQLGNGSTRDSATPVLVPLPLGRTAIAIATGYLHTCAMLDNGTAACWGYNFYGQLGNGSMTSSSVPVLASL